MANIYEVCPERAAQHKGYGDFVQHTNPLRVGLLRLSIRGAQTLCNSFGCVQIKLGEMLSLKLKADNSLISLISVREPELVNPLLQLNYRESRELANSLIQLNSVDSTESANSLIMSKTCIAGTSPNVLMKFDSDNFPSRDDTQKAQKEKGSTVNAAFLHNVDWDQSLSCLVFLRWRRLISPLAAVTKKPAVLSPSSLTCSISSRSSSGSLTETCKDLLFFLPVAITGSHCGRWCSVCTKNYSIQSLTWCSPENILVVFTLLLSWCIISEAQLDGNPVWAPNHNVIGANTMAFTHSTQTRPKFTYLFLGTPSDLPTCTPTVLRAEADSEAEARAKFIDWDLTFAAQIRTAAPSRLQLFSTDDGFMWIYEQRQEASHA